MRIINLEDGLKYKFIGISALKAKKIIEINDLIKKIREISDKYSVEIQVLNADKIASWENLFFASINALKSFQGRYNIANNLPIQTLLYLAADRQIQNAIKNFGIKKDTSKIAVIIFSNLMENITNSFTEIKNLFDGIENENLLELNNEKFNSLLGLYKISDIELSNLMDDNTEKSKYRTLIKLIIDRGSLISLEK